MGVHINLDVICAGSKLGWAQEADWRIVNNTERYKRAHDWISTILTDDVEKNAAERQAKMDDEVKKAPSRDVKRQLAPARSAELRADERRRGAETRSADDEEADPRKRVHRFTRVADVGRRRGEPRRDGGRTRGRASGRLTGQRD